MAIVNLQRPTAQRSTNKRQPQTGASGWCCVFGVLLMINRKGVCGFLVINKKKGENPD